MKKQYAVNIADMTKDLIISQFLLVPLIDKDLIIACEKTLDGAAVLLVGDEEKIKACIEIVRKKYSKNLFRFYYGSSKTWRRV